MWARAVPKGIRVATVAAGLVFAGAVVSLPARATDPPPPGAPSGCTPSESRPTGGVTGEFRAVANVAVTVVLGPALQLKAWVSAGQAAVVPASSREPARGPAGGPCGETPSTSLLVNLPAPPPGGERLQLSIFASTPWVLFARATSGQSLASLVLGGVEHGPGRELQRPEGSYLVPRVTLSPGGAGMLLVRSNRIGVTALVYLLEPAAGHGEPRQGAAAGDDGESEPVQLRFDLLSVSP